ncbi:uncharacterized protein F4812DRAFT_455002 [Daldinia caldariorum]|uniref:uncharacterized protein n=1 Tax=Daldinia caldariorum TaxID=326644 RepID=UPI00200830A0|nr:uncharacterized protein F4812DRAFT_455002 [Daldinia caldariorum]KAI1473188.1 hypothetical protein F4812DRAFT_455002 [Daldinia caldariorum]
MASTSSQLLDLSADVVYVNICGLLLPKRFPPYKTFRDYLDACESARDLMNLGLTCKSLYSLVAPLLARCKGHPYDTGFMSYVYNMITDPDLAARETTFKLGPSDINGLVQDVHLDAVERRARDLAIALPSWFRSDLQRERISPLQDTATRHDSRAQLTFILLMTLPNLTSLTTYATWPPSIPRTLPLPSFPSLRHLKLVGYDNISHNNISASTDIVQFRHTISFAPNLNVFETVNMTCCTESLHLPKADTIRMLSCRLMRRGWINGMINVLRHCSPLLKTFIYRSGHYDIYLQRAVPGVNDRGRRIGDISPQNVVDALVKTRMSAFIETLEIDMREWFINDPDTEYVHNLHAHRSYKFIGYLSRFTSLRTLTLTQQTLWENWYDNYPALEGCKSFNDPMRLVELLPTFLETFALYDVTASFLGCIMKLVEHVGPFKTFPNLKKLILRPSPGLVREFAHVRGHRDGPPPPCSNGEPDSCGVDREILSRWAQLITAFEMKGVVVDSEPEAHPLDTEDKDALRRQRELQHWCEECHYDSAVCVKRTKWHCVYPE